VQLSTPTAIISGRVVSIFFWLLKVKKYETNYTPPTKLYQAISQYQAWCLWNQRKCVIHTSHRATAWGWRRILWRSRRKTVAMFLQSPSPTHPDPWGKQVKHDLDVLENMIFPDYDLCCPWSELLGEKVMSCIGYVHGNGCNACQRSKVMTFPWSKSSDFASTGKWTDDDLPSPNSNISKNVNPISKNPRP
jgi:hypothetical protein